MGLHLSSRDLTHYRETTETLLSPLDHPDALQWGRSVLQRAEALFGADRSLMILPVGGEARALSESLPAPGLHAIRSELRLLEPDGFRSDWPDLERVIRRRRAAALEVWDMDALILTAGLSRSSAPFYEEVMVPSGVGHGFGLTVALPLGEVFLGIAHSRPALDPLGVESRMELLGILLPAFKSGARLLAQLEGRRDAVVQALDASGHAAIAYDVEGRELHRSARLARILAHEPEAEQLMAAMRMLALSAASLRRRPSKTAPARPERVGAREISTARGRYRIRAAFVAAGVFGPGAAILVTLDSPASALPTPAELSRARGLTPREAEIALLLAAGASNHTVATRLGISPHTVRAHAEHVFAKLGIHSRAALALELLS